MQKQKNIKLIISIGIIITIIVSINFFNDSSNGLSIDKRKFTLDQQTVITDVLLKSSKQNNHLGYENRSWRVNSRYELDPNMRDVFFSVLSQMEIRRTVPLSMNDSVVQLIKSKGVEVSILNNQEIVKEYAVLGDSDSQKSYIMDSKEKCYLVHIPGYRSYVAGIFEVPETDWRTRRSFTALFTNLNSLKIKYPTEEIEFQYENSFFKINGINADSTELITSLENLLFLQTDQHLKQSEHSKYQVENITNNNLIASIQLTKLSGSSETLSIYNTTENGPYYVGVSQDSSFCLFNKKRLNNIIVKKSDFQ